jgi:hypothetical protein
MMNETYDKQLTAILVIDAYNGFICEGRDIPASSLSLFDCHKILQ